MDRKVIFSFIAIYSIAAGLGYFFASNDQFVTVADVNEPASYILQGETTFAVAEAVRSVSGEIMHEFEIINAVAATLTLSQRDELLDNPAILAIGEDVPVKTAGINH